MKMLVYLTYSYTSFLAQLGYQTLNTFIYPNVLISHRNGYSTKLRKISEIKPVQFYFHSWEEQKYL